MFNPFFFLVENIPYSTNKFRYELLKFRLIEKNFVITKFLIYNFRNCMIKKNCFKNETLL